MPTHVTVEVDKEETSLYVHWQTDQLNSKIFWCQKEINGEKSKPVNLCQVRK